MKLSFALCLFLGFTFCFCKESSPKHNQKTQEINNIVINRYLTDSLIVYQTENLLIKKLSNHIYQHISYLKTDNFGKVACNGMLVLNKRKGIVFDTPTDNESSLELINFVTNELNFKIIALIPTHFHDDCVGGIAQFEANHIQTYASNQTIKFLKMNTKKFSKPIKGFDSILILNIGNKKVYAEYFGEGHTKDNVIGYVPEENTLFGGCLIKEIGASKGYLGDANTEKWPETVEKIKLKFPNANIVIPGHGKWGNTELLDYTIKLFK
ncbi:subclass B1 metallo-beta-lactamase [Mariniflexile gromovii]|uniref:beta-lactamase n=2 Tax=Mariniflexile gromovii TaxID=362523 RepID=A0ABS4BT68_9FLAO|nr:subclass B1 metallo-beta-lactamase [Mariniflexile gromovii]MBP0903783.1 subclass B1 metallo-beta-lactamase [Mariniflexile gromovii]